MYIFFATDAKYSEEAVETKQDLIDIFGWTITDGGVSETPTREKLITGGGDESNDVQHRKWSLFGKSYGSQDRMYKGKKYLYITAKEKHAGMYQSFPTQIGKTYVVSATLLGADVNKNGKFKGSSYLSVDSKKPTTSSKAEHKSHYVTGDKEEKVSFEFTATSTTSYVSVRSSKAWNYANARFISVKEKK